MNMQYKLMYLVMFYNDFGYVESGTITKINHISASAYGGTIDTYYDIHANGVTVKDVHESRLYVGMISQTVNSGTGGTRKDLLDALKTGDANMVKNSLVLGANVYKCIEDVTNTLGDNDFIVDVAHPFSIVKLPSESIQDFRQRVVGNICYMVDSFNSFVNTASALNKVMESPPIKSVKQCLHSWKTYQGLMEKYDYCTHCDMKRN